MSDCQSGSCGCSNEINLGPEQKTVNRNIQCQNCNENNIYKGIITNQSVMKIRCQCGQILNVQTDKEIETGHLE